MTPHYRKNNLASALGSNESAAVGTGRSQSAPRYLILETQDLPLGCRPGDCFQIRIVSVNGGQSVGMVEESLGSKTNPIWTMPPESPTP